MKSAPVDMSHYPRPLGLPRAVLFGFYALLIVLVGCTYWGWMGLSTLLYQSGAYEDLCPPLSELSMEDIIWIGGQQLANCDARKQAIANIYTYALTAQYVFALTAGVIVDKIGPKLACMLGLCTSMSGWLMLSFSTPTLRMYYPGVMMLALSVDLQYLPILGVSYLFPDKPLLVVSFLGSCRSASFGIPPLMSRAALAWGLTGTAVWLPSRLYVLIVAPIAFSIAAFLVPMVPFSEQIRQKEVEMQELEKSGDVEADTPLAPEMTLKKAFTWMGYPLIYFYFMIIAMRAEFYSKSSTDQLVASGGDAYNAFSLALVFSSLPGSAFGIIADKVNLQIAQAIQIAIVTLQFGLVMIPSLWAKQASCFCVVFGNSFLTSAMVCDLRHWYPSCVLARMVGLTLTLSSLGILLNIPLYNYCTRVNSFFAVDMLYVLLGGIALALTYYKWHKSTDLRAALVA